MGILGFASSKSFVIIDLESQKPFKWLQCVDDPSTAFVLSDPLLAILLIVHLLRELSLSPLGEIKEEDLVISVIVTITERRRHECKSLRTFDL